MVLNTSQDVTGLITGYVVLVVTVLEFGVLLVVLVTEVLPEFVSAGIVLLSI
jgi:hypothetical protein